ncbi:CBL-interacting serine/threonine-protein kinase 4-like [Silene latifolia]|uniref:CBL-interacting serine/threonine-protein kinase 4-like n=1 Tax=Silene latifolia TaxID=37657 RepID=UPI003D783478
MAAADADATPPPTADPTSPKTVLGRYQLGRVLGRGSFAKVYHARSLSDNKSVAIKVIDKLKTNPSIYPKIIGEVAAMRRLDHPNILRIHEVMATKHKIYMVMELAKGGDLFAKLTRRRDHRLPEPLARRYFHQLVSALHYCHRNGVAHRDVKPQNLLLDDQGNVKVADFGLSAIVQTPLNNSNHLLKTACGTPAFAAPEIVGRTRAGYDGSKADAWSCGVILFVLLSGYLPFDDANLVLMYRSMFKREFRFPSWLSKPARGLITRLLDPNPKTRLSIEGIMEDSWLKNQGMVYPRSVSLGDMASLEENKRSWSMESTSMNAFEIISMSSGLDLSGLLATGDFKGKREKRFTSRESKGVVVEKVAETGLKLGYEVERREKGFASGGGGGCSVWLGKGRLVLSVAVIEVAAEVVVVEVRVVDGGGLGLDQEELHWGELKIGLGDIVVSWHNE